MKLAILTIAGIWLGLSTVKADELKFRSLLLPEGLDAQLSSKNVTITPADLTTEQIAQLKEANSWPPPRSQWEAKLISLTVPGLAFEWVHYESDDRGAGLGMLPQGLFVTENREGLAIVFSEMSKLNFLYFTRSHGKWSLAKVVEKDCLIAGTQSVQHLAFLPVTDEVTKAFGIKAGSCDVVVAITLSPRYFDEPPVQMSWAMSPDRIEEISKSK